MILFVLNLAIALISHFLGVPFMVAIFWCLRSTNNSTPHYTNNSTLDSTFDSQWIFGPTLKPWYSNNYLVIPWNLDTWMNIWSHLETLILEWMISTDIKWYVCKGNEGPGEMLLIQPRLWSSTKHSCFLYVTFDCAKQSTWWAVKLTVLLTIAWKCKLCIHLPCLVVWLVSPSLPLLRSIFWTTHILWISKL